MKLTGCLLLLSGWIIALAALILLTTLAQRSAFVASSIGVEILGLILITRSYTQDQKTDQKSDQRIIR